METLHDLDHVKLAFETNKPGAVASQPKAAPTKLDAFSKANHKLEYYLTLIRSNKAGLGLVKLVEDLLSSDGVYVFGEILDCRPIKELAHHPEHSGYVDLIEIFAYGTWKHYCERRASLPCLNRAQARKLKQLTIISRASQSRVIPYSELLELLDVSNIQDLEELMIDAIYTNLMEAKLDQKRCQVEVELFMGRDILTNINSADVEMDSVEGQRHSSLNILQLRDQVQSWFNNINKVAEQLDAYIESIRQSEFEFNEAEMQRWQQIQDVMEKLPSASLKTAPQTNLKAKEKAPADDQPSPQAQYDVLGHHQEKSSPKTRKRTRA